ncbi:MAG: hydroxyacid dehydrogenase [Armatimonadota bacterium]
MAVIALFAPYSNADSVFTPRHVEQLRSMGTFIDARFDAAVAEVTDRLREVDYLVATWGMPVLDDTFLTNMPSLKGICYAAGSVKSFVTPALWERGIVVSSAAPMNAIPVAEYTVAVIILSNKRFWQMMRQPNSQAVLSQGVPGNYRRTVGLIGASMVGREVIRLLHSYDLRILLADPFVDAEEAARLGVTLVELRELMAQSDVVSLHAPNLPELRHTINADLLALMRDGATFVNTARGALVDEDALMAELLSGRIQAVLDVTDPEPPLPGSPFYSLPNVIYTPHIAGSMQQECHRMADFALDELARLLQGLPLQNAIHPAALAHLA